MKIVVNRCPIPMLWIDTSVIIDITKYRKQMALKDGLQYERMANLDKLIFEKTRNKKLFLVEGDQREEINSLIKESHDTHTFLSAGVKFQYRKQIHDNQLYRTMEAYLKNEDKLELPYEEAFSRDPIEEISGALKGLIISAYMETSDEEIKDRVSRKERLLKELEALRLDRLASGITYEQQLQQEYTAVIQAGLAGMKNLQHKFENKLEITYDDISQYSILKEVEEMWTRLSKELNNNDKSLMDFLLSEHYRAIPNLDIQSKLYADVITGVKPIQSGDSMDIQHLSTVIPYCDYVVTDLKMKNRINRLGIDKQYNTKVYCLRDANNLLSELSAL
ncbi:hypothetical protein ASG89_34900 [Paenibacillus sp. Soil766]|uniref:hypothetical protein n=1 Tax=Paenibacillus sp. Soil766 TaxID=1736404 RepID=UPI00070ED64E|nr:hypothetical protein [Paenibacillus sp. Soil766]KRE88288.1 hypothetical protein ASG89_34900 [Paenibacillus sp. Soil766]